MSSRLALFAFFLFVALMSLHLYLHTEQQHSRKDAWEVVEEDPPVARESTPNKLPQNGDIIFQISQSSQSKAIQIATASRYSHMGIIYEKDGDLFVYEAVQPVKLTPMNTWIKRGEKGHYVIKRLKDAEKILTEKALLKMKEVGDKFMGKDYDLYFGWSDDKLYCSELVWKIYQRGVGIEIGQLERMSDLDLEDEIVRKKMKERYGDHIPMDEKVISPASMFDSEQLELVFRNE